MQNTEIKTNATDVVNTLRTKIEAMPAFPSSRQKDTFIAAMTLVLEAHEETLEADKLAIKSLISEEQYKDKTVQGVASTYGLTANQVVVYLDMCEQMNNQTLNGTGVVVVPFWFHAQYLELQKQNEALIQEAANLERTVHAVGEKNSKGEDLSVHLPERSSIITGTTQPYVAGVTGPRIGDEHLDTDHVYLPNPNGRTGRR